MAVCASRNGCAGGALFMFDADLAHVPRGASGWGVGRTMSKVNSSSMLAVSPRCTRLLSL
eukprot:6561870-Alexandrium_andersonii.AAC.1